MLGRHGGLKGDPSINWDTLPRLEDHARLAAGVSVNEKTESTGGRRSRAAYRSDQANLIEEVTRPLYCKRKSDENV